MDYGKTEIEMRRWMITAPRLPVDIREGCIADAKQAFSNERRYILNLTVGQVLRRRGWSFYNVQRMLLGKRGSGDAELHRRMSNNVTKYAWDNRTAEQQQAAIEAADKFELTIKNMAGWKN